MTSSVSVTLQCPKPVRAVQVSGLLPKQPNRFLDKPLQPADSGEDVLLTKEITQIFQTRGGTRPVVATRQSPGQSLRQVQPVRPQVNPMLRDLAFVEADEQPGDFPWD